MGMKDSMRMKTKMQQIKNKLVFMMGICVIAGSLSACGDDTGVTLEAIEVAGNSSTDNAEKKWEEPIKAEDLAQNLDDAGKGHTEEDTADKNIKEEDSHDGTDNDMTDVSQKVITISAVGDVTLGNYLTQDYFWSFNETYEKQQNPAYFLENVADIFAEDDMTIVNLEGPLTTAEEYREGTYVIKGAPEYVNILTEGNVEMAGIANNHRLDYKVQGTKDTVNALEEAGIVYAYDENWAIYEVQGIRIGCVAVNEIAWGEGVERFLQEGIAQLQQEEADIIIASCHWGIERENYPEEYQQELGKKCIDWGADLVLGHHPHVLQGIEKYQGKYIVYSLGNFCFGANRNPADKDTIIFQQTFNFADGEKTEDTSIKIVPCSISSVSNRNDYKPTVLEGEDAARVIERMNEYSQAFGVKFDEKGGEL